MTKTTTASVGLDGHTDSVDIAVAEAGRRGEVRHVGTVAGDLTAVDKALSVQPVNATLSLNTSAGGRKPSVCP